jgi:hypothetical protein
MNDTEAAKPLLDMLVKRAFEYLLPTGFQYLGTALNSTAALGEYLEAVMRNPTTKRQIRAVYLPPYESFPAALRVFLEHGGRDAFALDDFIRYRGAAPEEVESLKLSNYQGNLEERLSACLCAAKAAMDKYAERIVSGSEWTHVPMDWKGIK